MSFSTSSPEVLRSLLAGIVAAASNGLIYAYSIYSTRMASILGLSAGDVVILGVLEQAGWGLVLLPITLTLRQARRRGFGMAEMDFVHIVFNAVMFLVANIGLGLVLRNKEQTGVDVEHTFLILALCFLCFGAAAGSTALLIMSIANHNLVTTVSDGIRRRALAALSLAVAIGGITFVCVYEYGLKTDVQLSSVFFGKAAWYAVLNVAQYRWMQRVKPRRDVSLPHTTAAVTTIPNETSTNNMVVVATAQTAEPQSLVKLLRFAIVQEMFLSTFFAIGISGTFLSSIGNFISPSMTFTLTMLFLSSQAVARFANAVIYAGGKWPYLFSLWHLVCLLGVAIFLLDSSQAYASSILVGLSFGGFHSAMPVVITAAGFPGSVDDYPQSFALVELIGSLGAIIVGQISVSVYHATSLSDFSVDVTFVFFVIASFIATLVSFDMGRRLKFYDRQVAVTNVHSMNSTTTNLLVASSSAAAISDGDDDNTVVVLQSSTVDEAQSFRRNSRATSGSGNVGDLDTSTVSSSTATYLVDDHRAPEQLALIVSGNKANMGESITSMA